MIIPYSYEPDIRLITRFLTRDNENGYGFAVAVNQAVIPGINREIMRLASGENKRVSLFSFDTTNLSNPIIQLKEAIDQDPSDGLIIINLDLCVMEGDQILLAMNFAREELFRLGKPLLFWIGEKNLGRLNQVAKDFFVQRRISTVWFQSISSPEPEEILTKRFDEFLMRPEDLDQLTRKVHLLTEQLRDAEQKGVASGRIVEEIVAPLLKLYAESGLLEQALDLVTTYKGAIIKGTAGVLIQAGDIYRQAGDLSNAKAMYEKAKTDLGDRLLNNPENEYERHLQSIVLERLGKHYETIGNFEQALKLYSELATLCRELHEANPRNVELQEGLGIAHYKLAIIHKELNNEVQAREHYEEWRKILADLKKSYPQVAKYKEWGMIGD